MKKLINSPTPGIRDKWINNEFDKTAVYIFLTVKGY